MIIIQDTSIKEVHDTVVIEQASAVGIKDTIALLKNSSDKVNDVIDAYVSKNAILKSIQNAVTAKHGQSLKLVEAIEFAESMIIIMLPKLEAILKASKNKVFDTETVSFKERGVFDMISSINFFNRYASMAIDVVLQATATNEEPNKYLRKVDFEFFNNNGKYFAILLNKFCSGAEPVLKTIDNLSDEIYDAESAEVIRGLEGPEAVTLNGMAPHHLNPYFWYKKVRVKQDVNTIRANNETIDVLAMKIARLSNRVAETPDPSLERAIEVYENQIIHLRSKNAEIEAKYA